MNPMQPRERPFDSRPHFVIPYWSSPDPTQGDDGDIRPVPSNKAVWYLCESIHASPYQPGKQLDVKVDIANYGGANTPSIAQVTVWWSDPTAGFVVGPDKLIGYRTVEVNPRGGRNTTLVMSKVIPSSAPTTSACWPGCPTSTTAPARTSTRERPALGPDKPGRGERPARGSRCCFHSW